MDAREFEEMFRQVYESGDRRRVIFLTTLYSTSSIYSIPEIMGRSPLYIPLSGSQKIFIGESRTDPPPGFLSCPVVGKRMTDFVRIFTEAGFRMSGFRLSGKAGEEAKVSRFTEFSDVVLDRISGWNNVNLDEFSFSRSGTEIGVSMDMTISVSGAFPDISVILRVLKLHEQIASGSMDAYRKAFEVMGHRDFRIKPSLDNGENITWPVNWIPGHSISVSLKAGSGFETAHVEDRNSPQNWVRSIRGNGSVKLVRGPFCSFAFFSSFMQMMGDTA